MLINVDVLFKMRGILESNNGRYGTNHGILALDKGIKQEFTLEIYHPFGAQMASSKLRTKKKIKTWAFEFLWFMSGTSNDF